MDQSAAGWTTWSVAPVTDTGKKVGAWNEKQWILTDEWHLPVSHKAKTIHFTLRKARSVISAQTVFFLFFFYRCSYLILAPFLDFSEMKSVWVQLHVLAFQCFRDWGLSGLRFDAMWCINDTNIFEITLFHLPSCWVVRALCLPSLFSSWWWSVCPKSLTLAASLICNPIWRVTPLFRVIFINCQIIPMLKLAIGYD